MKKKYRKNTNSKKLLLEQDHLNTGKNRNIKIYNVSIGSKSFINSSIKTIVFQTIITIRLLKNEYNEIKCFKTN